MSFTGQYKENRPFGGTHELAEHIGPGMFNPNVEGLGLSGLLEPLMLAAGINVIIQVNDTQTSGDWTESDDTTFDFAVGSAGTRVGTNALKLTATASTDNSQYVQTLFIDESSRIGINTSSAKRQQDWRNTRYIGWWHHAVQSAEYGTLGEMQFAIVNDGTLQTKVELDGNVTTSHQWQQIDMEDIEGDGTNVAWDRDKVEAIRFYSNNTNTGEDYYANNIIRYQISYDRGPLYGCMFPITSGTTLANGETVAWSISGLVASSSAAAVADLGPVRLFQDGLPVISATGTATRNVWGFVPGVYIFIGRSNGSCTAGDLAEWASSRHLTDVTTTATSKGFAMALETDGEAEDDIMFTLVKPGESA
jgi:hypothetical protein